MSIFRDFKVLPKSLAALAFLTLFSASAYAQKKAMFLGDSITRGVTGSTDNAGFRNDFADLVNNEGVVVDFVGTLSDGVGFDNDHEGHDGFRADQIFANINTYLGANPDIIIFHIGTNDISADQTPESTRDEIANTVDAIHNFNPNIKIIVTSIVPRTDGKDTQTTSLNSLIQDMFFTKRDDEGRNLFYAGVNEIFKTNPNWATAYMDDAVHPNDTGYSIMAQTFFDVFLVANSSSTTLITDNFERTNLGITWAADPEFVLQNGDLVNTATTGTGNWEYMATYKAIKNPSSVRIKWAADAEAINNKEGGIAVLLDAPTANADGFLAWLTESDNTIRLWTINNGSIDQDLNLEKVSEVFPAPGPGDEFRVDLTVDGSNLQFDYYVRGVFAGNITKANDTGVGGDLYSGVVLRHARANDIDDFTLIKTSDTDPPAPVGNLAAGSATATSISLSWTASGDDGSTGQATSYDVRYSTQIIDNSNFANATQVTGAPSPAPFGSLESVVVSGLDPGTQYFFALKVIDEAGNTSTLSNVVTSTTVAGNFFVDDFTRVDLGADWTTAADYAIVNNALSNTSTATTWNEVAVVNSRKSPEEVSFTWTGTADADGIDQAGFVLVFGSPSATGNGYAITRRKSVADGGDNSLRLWELVNGTITNTIEINKSVALSPPQAGDKVKIRIFADGSANRFDFFINDVLDAQVSDPNFLFDLSADNWAGVILRANTTSLSLNNDIDDFTMLLKIGAPTNLSKFAGDAQQDTVGQPLPIPLTVKIGDESGSPIQGVNVNFAVTGGGGSVDVAPPKDDIIIEAESGVLTDPMIVGSDAGASNSAFISVPEGAGGNGLGKATFTINIEQAGDYVMWGRAIFPSAQADAFKVWIDSDSASWDVGQRNHQSDWNWDEVSDRAGGNASNPQFNPKIFNLTSGLHSMRIEEAKDGTQLDQFVLTRVGSGFQPPADQSALIPGGTFSDTQGLATANLTLGPAPGFNTVVASVNGLGSVTFTAEGIAGKIDSIVIVSGNAQVGTSGQALAAPFVVKVFDEFGNPATNSETTWTVLPPGNGTLSGGGTVVADLLGQASNILTLATDTGLNRVQVSAVGYTGPDIIFTATPQAGAATKIALAAGDNQTGTAGTPLQTALQALVTDALDVPVVGHSVSFNVVSGGGNIGGSSSISVLTDPTGIANVTLTLGPQPEQQNQVQAVASGLQGSPITFTATSAAPQNLETISSLTQSGVANLPLDDSISVRVRDVLGQSLPFFPVTFEVTLGQGKINGSDGAIQVNTNSEGIAKVEWRMGPQSGTNNNKLQASATWDNQALSGSPIVYTASAVVGAAQDLIIAGGNNQTGTIEQDLSSPFAVIVTDANGNPVVSWPVTFDVIAGGGNIGGQASVLVPTNAQGRSEVLLTLGNTVGSQNNQVSASSPQTNTVTFFASANSSGATTLALVSGGGQTGQAGVALTQKIQVRVTDNIPNNIVSHEVFFKVLPGSGGATINGQAIGDTVETLLTNSNGIAEVTWYLGGALGTNSQSLEIMANDGLNQLSGSPLTVTASAIAGTVDPDVSTVVSNKSALQADGQDEAGITVTLVDKFGNPIPGQAVTILSSGNSDIIIQPQNPTDANGEALGTIRSFQAGEKTIMARIIGGIQLNSSAAVNFLAEPPDQVEPSSGDGQTTNVGTSLDNPISVLVTDNFNNPVSGVTVDFRVTSGGGRILNPRSVVTDANGLAEALWVLGSAPGSNTAEARALFNNELINGSPVVFNATGVATAATEMSLSSGANQQGVAAGQDPPIPLGVLVTDASGDPVFDVEVNFDVSLGDGTLENETTRTNFQGIASTGFTLGPVVGTNIVQASSAGLSGSPIIFEFESVVGQASKLTRHAGNDAEVQVNNTHVVSVMITDFFDNLKAGVHVNFEAISGGASIQIQDGGTNASGIASATVQMPTNVAEVVVKAASDDLPGFFVNFQLQAVAAPATNIAEYAGNNQQGTVGRPLVHSLQVKVTDAFGNPVSGFSVPWLAFGGTIATSPTTTDDDGVASAEWTLGASTGNYEARAVVPLSPSQIFFQATAVTNSFPEFVGLSDTAIVEGNLLQFEVNAVDNDEDPITFSTDGLPSGASFDTGSRVFTWIPAITQQGEFQVTFIAQDNRGGFDSETLTIQVLNSNNPPVINAFAPTLAEFQEVVGGIVNFSVTVEDADVNDVITYTWLAMSPSNPGGQLLSVTPSLQFDTSFFEKGTYAIRVEVTDGRDETHMEWTVHLVTTIELASFSGQFNGFDGVLISWVTSREVGNTGFDILRSLRQDGEFEKVNSEVISVSENGNYEFSDQSVKTGQRYYYVLEDIDLNGGRSQHGPIMVDIVAPQSFVLNQNFPNPFNPDTKIQYELPEAAQVDIRIFDVLGREVRTLVNERIDPGFHEVTWNGRDDSGVQVSSGVYYYHIVAGENRQTKKMLLLK